MTSDWKPYNYHSFENKRYHITVIILLKSQIKLNTMVKTKRLAHLASVCWSGSSSNPAKLLSVSPSKQLSLLLRTSWPQEMKAGATGALCQPNWLCIHQWKPVFKNQYCWKRRRWNGRKWPKFCNKVVWNMWQGMNYAETRNCAIFRNAKW